MTNPHKLQKQFDFLKSNPEFSLCEHASYLVNRDEKMSAYRTGLEQSWTKRTYTDTAKTLKHFDHTIQMLDALNQYSDFTLDDTIQWKK